MLHFSLLLLTANGSLKESNFASLRFHFVDETVNYARDGTSMIGLPAMTGMSSKPTLKTWSCNVCSTVKETTNPRSFDQRRCATVADRKEEAADRNGN